MFLVGSQVSYLRKVRVPRRDEGPMRGVGSYDGGDSYLREVMVPRVMRVLSQRGEGSMMD